MSSNKNLLALAVAGGLLSTAAQAVDITAGAPVAPVRIASEVNIPAGGQIFTNLGALNISSQFQYNFSAGEVRYARIECTDTIEITSAAVAIAGTGTPGAVNGIGTNAINFSVTAGAALISTNTVTINGNRNVLAQGPVNCTYSLYDQPSQAAAGGPAGLIVTSSGAYLTFASSYLYALTANTSTSNVEAVPSFTGFVVPGNPTGSAQRAQLAQFSFDNRSAIAGGGTQPIKADGTPATTVDILAAATSHIIDGDFSAAANADGTFTTLNRVFVSAAADCSAVTAAATAITATSARFETGPNTFAGLYLCYTPRGGVAIPASTYTFRLAPVSNAGYTGGTLGPSASGTIVRNGTELQAPLAQIPGGFISRLVLTNTGTVARTYTAQVLRETGNTGTVGSAVTGTIPANGTLVVDMADVLGTFTTGAPRGTVNVNVAGPTGQIQGLYQIVNPASGGISNHVMVRPGTN